MAFAGITYFEGPAGTGKTTQLMKALGDLLHVAPLREGEAVLALTRFHGSRRRLTNRLHRVNGLDGRFHCCTVDSFARNLTLRWVTFARAEGQEEPRDVNISFDLTCQTASRLLDSTEVIQWVARTHPILLVDEMQDLRGGRLELIQKLASRTRLLAAADDFQELLLSPLENDHGSIVPSCPAVDWLRSSSEPCDLSTVHRTAATGLLAAARQIRSAESIIEKGDGFNLFQTPNHNVAASFVATNLTWYGANDVALLTPTGPESSVFICNTVKRLQHPLSPKCLNGKEVGPFFFRWESRTEEECRNLAIAVGLDDSKKGTVTLGDLQFPKCVTGTKSLYDYLLKRRRIKGVSEYTIDEIRAEISRIVQLRRSFGITNRNDLRAMTIHQAKNREFRHVICLWPYEVPSVSDSLRRLLYNAVTRAKERALVLVQGYDDNPMIQRPPFVSDRP